MKTLREKIATPADAMTYKIIGLAMAIHNELGPGFSEENYQRAMVIGPTEEAIAHQTEYRINLSFRHKSIGAHALDFVVDEQVIVELKALVALAPVHKQPTLAYLAASGLPVALPINFGAAKLEYQRLFPPKAVQASTAYQARRSNSRSSFTSIPSVPSVDPIPHG